MTRFRARKSLFKSFSRVLLLILTLTHGCSGGLTTPARDARLRVLFIGNSLTYSNDLPAIVSALAASSGKGPIAHKTVAFPDYSLEDHWNQGEARRKIAEQKWDYIVMQQGPSALPESRKLLVEYTRRFSEEIRKSGARPALYMVWPSKSRLRDFDGVRDSYIEAAQVVDGLFIPAGEAWRVLLRNKPELALYSPDGLHPTLAGSYLAAAVICQRLFALPSIAMPSRLQVRSKTVSQIELSSLTAEMLQAAAMEASRPSR